jgi:hypothetical protein
VNEANFLFCFSTFVRPERLIAPKRPPQANFKISRFGLWVIASKKRLIDALSQSETEDSSYAIENCIVLLYLHPKLISFKEEHDLS